MQKALSDDEIIQKIICPWLIFQCTVCIPRYVKCKCCGLYFTLVAKKKKKYRSEIACTTELTKHKYPLKRKRIKQSS